MSNYRLESGVVYRGNTAMADVDERGTVTYRPGYSRFGGPIKKFLHERKGRPMRAEKPLQNVDDIPLEKRFPDYPGKPDKEDPKFNRWLHRVYPAEAAERERRRQLWKK